MPAEGAPAHTCAEVQIGVITILTSAEACKKGRPAGKAVSFIVREAMLAGQTWSNSDSWPPGISGLDSEKLWQTAACVRLAVSRANAHVRSRTRPRRDRPQAPSRRHSCSRRWAARARQLTAVTLKMSLRPPDPEASRAVANGSSKQAPHRAGG